MEIAGSSTGRNLLQIGLADDAVGQAVLADRGADLAAERPQFPAADEVFAALDLDLDLAFGGSGVEDLIDLRSIEMDADVAALHLDDQLVPLAVGAFMIDMHRGIR